MNSSANQSHVRKVTVDNQNRVNFTTENGESYDTNYSHRVLQLMPWNILER